MPTYGSTEQAISRDIIRSPITQILAATTISTGAGSSSVTSSTFDAVGYREAIAYLTVSDTGSTAAAVTLQFIPQFATDTAGTYFDYREGVWASMIFSAAQLQTSTFYRAHTLPLDGRKVRFTAERSSTIDAHFTVGISLEAHD